MRDCQAQPKSPAESSLQMTSRCPALRYDSCCNSPGDLSTLQWHGACLTWDRLIHLYHAESEQVPPECSWQASADGSTSTTRLWNTVSGVWRPGSHRIDTGLRTTCALALEPLLQHFPASGAGEPSHEHPVCVMTKIADP